MLESYFRNNADLGTGLLMARFCYHQPPFFYPDSPPYALPAPTSNFIPASQQHVQPVLKWLYRGFFKKSLANDPGTVRTKCPTWRFERP
jgi:hypothetical protein